VQARFNESITNTLFAACRDELLALGVPSENIDHVLVPGALEVPVALQPLAEKDSTTPWSRWAASSAARPTTSSWWPTNRARA
jgi:6,7-dimethyl-8-ribityllumazine synthase